MKKIVAVVAVMMLLGVSMARAQQTDKELKAKRAAWAKEHPEAAAYLKERHEKRQAWLRAHPKEAQEIKEHKAKRAAWAKAHPDEAAKLKADHKARMEKFNSMTDEQKAAWLKDHPAIAKRVKEHRSEAVSD